MKEWNKLTVQEKSRYNLHRNTILIKWATFSIFIYSFIATIAYVINCPKWIYPLIVFSAIITTVITSDKDTKTMCKQLNIKEEGQ